MRLRSIVFAAVTSTTLAAIPSPSLARSTGLEDMVGARAGQAEGELQRRGYRNVRGEQGDDRSYTYWWNADRRQCVSIATMEGRYDSITPTTAPDCLQPSSARSRRDDADRATPAVRPPSSYAPDARYGRPPDRFERDDAGDPGGGAVIGGRPVDLALVCFGDGARNGVASGTRWRWNSDRERYESERSVESTTEVFDATLTVQTWPGGGRIRLPRSLIPPINSRGNNGWWDLSDMEVGRDLIRASYRLNGLNKPRVEIDRRNGRITVQGTASYGFRGTCDLIGNEPRKF